MARSPCLQPAHLNEHASSHECKKSERGHHRYCDHKNWHTPDQQEASTRKFLRKNTTNHTCIDYITTGPISLLDSTLFHREGRDTVFIRRAEAQASSTFSPGPTSLPPSTRTRPSTTEDIGNDELLLVRMVLDSGQPPQPLAEELSSSAGSLTSIPSASSGATQAALTTNKKRSPSLRKLRLSISRNLARPLPDSKVTMSEWTSNLGPKPRLISTAPQSASTSPMCTSSLSSSFPKSGLNPQQPLKWRQELNNSDNRGKSAGASQLPLRSPSLDPTHLSLDDPSTPQTGRTLAPLTSPTAAEEPGWFINLNGEKYHPHLRSDLPYWMSYRPEIMNHHILMLYAYSLLHDCSPFDLSFASPGGVSAKDGLNTSQKRLGQNQTDMHTLPISLAPRTRRVLDIGCGSSATWCVGVLREATGVEVVGLDICPLSLDLNSLERNISANFCFIQHDFLVFKLPFNTASFDYVHASFISPGIPEHKWTSLLEEMLRVLKPQGTLELLECNQLIADPMHAKNASSMHSKAPTSSTPSLPSETSKGSSADSNPTTVKGMIEKLLEKQFISQYPLSILPSEISKLSTGMKRAPVKTSIKFPSDLVSFVDTMAKSLDDSKPALTSSNNDQTAQEVGSGANETAGMLLLHSHVDALFSNKEISWTDVWLPSICSETPPATLDPVPVKSSRSIAYKPSPFGLNFSLPQRRQKTPNAKSRGKSNEQHEQLSLVNYLDDNQASPLTLRTSLSSGLPHCGDKTTLESSLNLERSSIPSWQLERNGSRTEQEKPQTHSMDVPPSQIRARRKQFDQIWDKWRDDLTSHSVGISKLLETRFGWTCTVDLENHKALHDHHQTYQHELAECELSINELRQRLRETNSLQPYQLDETGLEDSNATKMSHAQSTGRHTSSREISRCDSRQTEIHQEGHSTSFEEVIGPDASGINPRVFDHEPHTRQALGCSIPIDHLVTESAHYPTSYPRDTSIDVLFTSEQEAQTLCGNDNLMGNPDQDETESEDITLNDGYTRSLGHSSTVPKLVGVPALLQNGRQDVLDKLEAEIEKMVRKKEQLQKSIQMIQNDLDNVKKRLGLTEASGSRDYRFSATSTSVDQTHQAPSSTTTTSTRNGELLDPSNPSIDNAGSQRSQRINPLQRSSMEKTKQILRDPSMRKPNFNLKISNSLSNLHHHQKKMKEMKFPEDLKPIAILTPTATINSKPSPTDYSIHNKRNVNRKFFSGMPNLRLTGIESPNDFTFMDDPQGAKVGLDPTTQHPQTPPAIIDPIHDKSHCHRNSITYGSNHDQIKNETGFGDLRIEKFQSYKT